MQKYTLSIHFHVAFSTEWSFYILINFFTTDITQIWFVEEMIEKYIEIFRPNEYNPIKRLRALSLSLPRPSPSP